jgi:Rps23 Pro-64 3,4-dihydroxylase Tpa1-like proline 4-hydroxylase
MVSLIQEKSFDFTGQESFTELKSLYERALHENFSLRGEINLETSLSTLKPEKDSSVKSSFANEIEDLNEVLAKCMQSIKVLKEYKKELIENKLSAKKELDEQRGMHNFAKDNMVSLLQGKLNNTVDMLKTVYRDKKQMESYLDKEDKQKHVFQAQNAALEEKLKVLEGRNKELLSASQLTAQITNTLGKQEVINKKIEKYESYIQSKLKKS